MSSHRRRDFFRTQLQSLESRCVLATLQSGFAESLVASGLSQATSIDFSPDNKLFITEQAGTMQVWKNGSRLQANFFANAPIVTQATGERGLLGVTFDPNYLTNHFVYVYYTTTAADNHNRVSRFTANPTGELALAGSETILLELDPHTATNHNGGAIHFGRDGKLYVGVGDDANQDNPTSTTNAQRLTTLHGKLLRINADGTIPTDNPFYAQTTGKYRAIWALGLRNPFTFDVERTTGRLFINDVGQNTWEEIDAGSRGANYGWSTTEGSFNQSTYPGFTEPFYAYNHDSQVTTPSGNVITGGAFYDGTAHPYPTRYNNTYFFADLGGGWIYNIDLGTKNVSQFADAANAVDLDVDFAGNLYYLQYNGGVYRINYVALNHAPVLDTSKSPTLKPEMQNAKVPVGAIGTLVSSLVDFATPSGQVDNVTDVDAQSQLGIAIVGADTSHGTWYFTTDGGGTWQTFTVATESSAKLLTADPYTRLYFRPNTGFSGTLSDALTFRAWDQRTGAVYGNTLANGNATAYSTATDTIAITIVSSNHAPVLDASKNPILNSVAAGAGVPMGAVGTLVSSLVDFASPSGQVDNVTDVDAGAQLGIAVTSADSIHGTWYYSLNNGVTWLLMGNVTNTSARLLAADGGTRVFFRPNNGVSGTLAAALTFRAWDRTRGVAGNLADTSTNGGGTAFSVSSDNAPITVT